MARSYKIIRNERVVMCPASELKRGDILKLQEGETVPVDCIIARVLSSPCIIFQRHTPDYADFVDLETYGHGAQKAQLRNSSSKKLLQEQGQDDTTTEGLGWNAGVRICFPSAMMDSYAPHGSIVLWGAALAIASGSATSSTWARLWRAKELKDLRLLRPGATETEPSTDARARRIHVSAKMLAMHVEIMGMGLILKEAYCTDALHGITFLVVEDDIRFSRHETELVQLSDGIGVGCNCDEGEFYHRYADLTFSAQRAGIRVCVVLRADAVSPDDAVRLARKLRFAFCTADERTCDYMTAPLSAMFATEGAVIRVGSDGEAVANLVRALQRTQAKPLPPSIQELVNKSCSNPTGVIFHINQLAEGRDLNGVHAIDQVSRFLERA